MFGLLTPWFLVGLGALAVPVLVHLIHKERKDVLRFPSLMFIQPMPVQALRRQRIRHWWLFLLRCLAILLLVMAFARPFLPSHHAVAAAGPMSGRDIVIALDRSYSMGYGDRWQKAITAAKNVVDNMQSADRAAVTYFSGTASAATDLTHDKRVLFAALDSAHPGAGITRYDAALRLVQHLFGDTAQPRREVVLVSDFQQSGWSNRNLPTLPPGTTLTQQNVAGSTTDNVALTHVDIRYDTSNGRERAIVQARLANHSATPVRQRPITFELNGRQMQTRLVDCPANNAVNVDFDPVIAPPGSSHGIVRTPADSLPVDNQLYFVVTRAPALPVLVVEPDEGDTKSGAFLTRALGISDRLSFPVKVVRANLFSTRDLEGTALVILDGVPVPGGDLGRHLVDYVKDGGGVFIALGEHSRPTAWPVLANELLPRPSRIIDRTNDHGATLGYFDRAHPVFEVFTAPHSGDLSAPHYLRYWSITPTQDDRQLARFDDGNTAFLERRIGAGRIIVSSSDLNGYWNDLPLQPVFLPLVQQTAQYVAGYAQKRHVETVGDVLSLPTLFGESARPATTAKEDAKADDAQYVAIAPSGTQVRFTKNTPSEPASLELTETGFYKVNRSGSTGDSTLSLAVNVDVAESDLTPLDTGLFATVTAPATTARNTPQQATLLSNADTEHRQNLWWYLLAAALILLGTETLLSNRLSRPARAKA
jgi:hypothetical protein